MEMVYRLDRVSFGIMTIIFCIMSLVAYRIAAYPLDMAIDQENYAQVTGENTENKDNTQICGIHPFPDYLSNNNIPLSIVGGSEAVQRWPWQVLLLDNGGDRKPFCGGVFIGDRHVLTAAHCFDGHGRDDISVILGEHDRSYVEGTEVAYSIDCLFIHPRYLPNFPYNHDLALIKLKTFDESRIELTDNVLPVCLPQYGEFKTNTMCFITGWGYTGFEDLFADKHPSRLQEAQVPLINRRDCQNYVYGTLVTKQMQCAGFLQGAHRADTCKGDSGGPLMCPDERGNFKLWGITSWGNNHFCELEPLIGPVPGVYIRFDKYLKWIKKKMTTSKCE